MVLGGDSEHSALGFCLGLPTESNKWYSVVGVSGPILKSTTDITWGPGA